MKIAKRTLSISRTELNELFGLPEEVEIIDIKRISWGRYEFLLESAGEIFIEDTKITFAKNEEDEFDGRRLTLDDIKKAKYKNGWLLTKQRVGNNGEVLEVQKIIAKTNAKMFKYLKIGDKIMLSIPC